MILQLLFTQLKKYAPILILVALLLIQSYFFKKENSKVKDFKRINTVQQQEIQVWKDKAGKNRARADIAEINAKNAKLVLSEELKSMLKQEVGNIKRNLISYADVKASTQGKIQGKAIDTVYVIDSIKTVAAKQFVINNKDLKFKGSYIPALDSLIADYKVQHNFEVFYYYRKSGKKPWNVFNRKKAVAEIKFENHGTQADSLFTIVLERKKSLWKRFLVE